MPWVVGTYRTASSTLAKVTERIEICFLSCHGKAMLDRLYMCGCGCSCGCVYDCLTGVSIRVRVNRRGDEVGGVCDSGRELWTAKQEPADEGDEKWHHA
jgi:hypothetical protein